MAQESVVQVAPDSTGKKIRNLQLDVIQPDGTTATVQMQVIIIADANGNLLATEPVRGFGLLSVTDVRVLEQLNGINDALTKILAMLAYEFEQTVEDFDGED
jgi:uncharacterized protein (UPF0254 family)